MSALVERLRVARAKIERPECWTKGAYRRDWTGVSTTGRGVCWCAVGALEWTIKGERAALTAALPEGVDRDANGAVENFNDHPDTTHADVLALYDRAIAAAEGS